MVIHSAIAVGSVGPKLGIYLRVSPGSGACYVQHCEGPEDCLNPISKPEAEGHAKSYASAKGRAKVGCLSVRVSLCRTLSLGKPLRYSQ